MVEATVVSAPVAPPPTVQVGVTADDLARLEASILERVRAEVNEQIGAVAHPAEARLAVIEGWVDDQMNLNVAFNGQFGRLNRATSSLSEQIELSRLQNVGLDGGAR
jgi:hypothetical protein